MNEVSVSDGNVMTRSSQTEMMISRQAQDCLLYTSHRNNLDTIQKKYNN